MPKLLIILEPDSKSLSVIDRIQKYLTENGFSKWKCYFKKENQVKIEVGFVDIPSRELEAEFVHEVKQRVTVSGPWKQPILQCVDLEVNAPCRFLSLNYTVLRGHATLDKFVAIIKECISTMKTKHPGQRFQYCSRPVLRSIFLQGRGSAMRYEMYSQLTLSAYKKLWIPYETQYLPQLIMESVRPRILSDSKVLSIELE